MASTRVRALTRNAIPLRPFSFDVPLCRCLLLTPPFQNEESSGFIPSFSPKSQLWQCWKSPSVLPPALIACIFLDRLFFSATKGPFFDNFFFLWFGSHMFLNYNNMSEISPVIFGERTRLRNP